MSHLGIIIVTHNSQQVLQLCLESLLIQTVTYQQLVIVDSGSQDCSYLQKLAIPNCQLILATNIGFSRANNLAYEHLQASIELVLFLSPDTILTQNSCLKILEFFKKQTAISCLTGRLLGFDYITQQATQTLDSTGIFRTWYGRWYDRGQGEIDNKQYLTSQIVPISCGAFLCCRRNALETIALAKNIIFDPDFFLYKEDIELGLRLAQKKYSIWYQADLIIYHGRGWKKRTQMPYQQRLQAAKSELLLYQKHPSWYCLWAWFKYLLVRFIKV